MSKKVENEEIMEVVEQEVVENQESEVTEETKQSTLGKVWSAIKKHKVAVGVGAVVATVAAMTWGSRKSEDDNVVASYEDEGYDSFTIEDVNE